MPVNYGDLQIGLAFDNSSLGKSLKKAETTANKSFRAMESMSKKAGLALAFGLGIGINQILSKLKQLEGFKKLQIQLGATAKIAFDPLVKNLNSMFANMAASLNKNTGGIARAAADFGGGKSVAAITEKAMDWIGKNPRKVMWLAATTVGASALRGVGGFVKKNLTAETGADAFSKATSLFSASHSLSFMRGFGKSSVLNTFTHSLHGALGRISESLLGFAKGLDKALMFAGKNLFAIVGSAIAGWQLGKWAMNKLGYEGDWDKIGREHVRVNRVGEDRDSWRNKKLVAIGYNSWGGISVSGGKTSKDIREARLKDGSDRSPGYIKRNTENMIAANMGDFSGGIDKWVQDRVNNVGKMALVSKYLDKRITGEKESEWNKTSQSEKSLIEQQYKVEELGDWAKTQTEKTFNFFNTNKKPTNIITGWLDHQLDSAIEWGKNATKTMPVKTLADLTEKQSSYTDMYSNIKGKAGALMQGSLGYMTQEFFGSGFTSRIGEGERYLGRKLDELKEAIKQATQEKDRLEKIY